MLPAYRPDMKNTGASSNSSASSTGEHRRLVRDESTERDRVAAFWATYDANAESDERWAESVAASWRTAALRIQPRADTATP
jgi:hypothetical protein